MGFSGQSCGDPLSPNESVQGAWIAGGMDHVWVVLWSQMRIRWRFDVKVSVKPSVHPVVSEYNTGILRASTGRGERYFDYGAARGYSRRGSHRAKDRA